MASFGITMLTPVTLIRLHNLEYHLQVCFKFPWGKSFSTKIHLLHSLGNTQIFACQFRFWKERHTHQNIPVSLDSKTPPLLSNTPLAVATTTRLSSDSFESSLKGHQINHFSFQRYIFGKKIHKQ